MTPWILLLLLTRVVLSTKTWSYTECNFFLKQCNWTHLDNWNWFVPKYRDLWLDGPTWFHASSSNQNVLLANFNSSRSLQNMILVSPFLNLHPNYTDYCFKFRYYIMEGTLKLSLNELLAEDLWRQPGQFADLWYEAQVNIHINPPQKVFQLKFTATGFSYSTVAIANFKMTPGSCIEFLNECTFETGEPCGWHSTFSNGFKFKVVQASTTSNQIQYDHTIRSRDGQIYYLPIFKPYLPKPTLNSKLSTDIQSPKFNSTAAKCFSFWFILSKEISDFNITLHFEKEKLWSLSELNGGGADIYNEWIRVQVPIEKFSGSGALVFHAEASNSIQGLTSFALDDIRISPFECDMPVNCIFGDEYKQDGFCGWKDNNKDFSIFSWNLGIGRVINTGPLTFHNPVFNGKSVLYTDFTMISPHQGSKTIEILSDFVPFKSTTKDTCFTMSFIVKSLHPDEGDRFQLSVIDTQSGSQKKTLWNFKNLNTSSYHDWIAHARIVVPRFPKNNLPIHYIRFSLEATSRHQSTYIAVIGTHFSYDLQNCGPQPTPFYTTSTTTLKPSYLNCNFELNNTCEWKRGGFKVNSARRVQNMFMPYQDHTLNSLDGHFVYLHANETRTSGWLEAPNQFTNAKSICFTFAYYFYATEPSMLKLTLEDYQGHTIKELYKLNSANMIRWQETRLTINITKSNSFLSFVFWADVQNGALAIDDIQVFQGDCGQEEKDSCDFEMEVYCPFFQPVKRYTSPPNHHHPLVIRSWTEFQGNQFSIVDHTVHTQSGHFYGINFEKMLHDKQNNRYLLYTKTLTRSSCLQFSYYVMDAKPTTKLFIIPMFQGSFASEKLWEIAGNTGGMWFTHQHRINPPFDSYQIVLGIEVQLNSDNKDKVFIDDLSLIETNYCDKHGRCDFEDGDLCLLESLLVNMTRGHSYLTTTQKMELSQTKNYTKINPKFLISDSVDVSWHVFSPYQSSKFINHDHTTKERDGKYLLLTAHEKYDRGIFVTERFTELTKKKSICLSFALYKPDCQSVLEIYQQESNAQMALKIWDSRRQSCSNDWEMFQVYAQVENQTSVDMYFYFVGTFSVPNTYLALDDFFIKSECDNPSNVVTPKPNPSDYFKCFDGTRIPIRKTCDWVNDCSHGEDEVNCGTCKFKNSDQICDYQVNSLGEDFTFRFSNANSKYGPHDQGPIPSQKLFYMVASGVVNYAASTRFMSPVIHQTYTELCHLTFYYNFNHVQTGKMYLYLDLQDASQDVIYWDSRAQPLSPNEWNLIYLNLKRIKEPFRLVFEAKSDMIAAAYHAIAYIQLENCRPEKPSNQCSSKQFRCTNGVCIANKFVCDMEDDCGDQSDEMNCDPLKMTDFEENYGIWGRFGIQNWHIIEASKSPGLDQAPTYDHTTGLRQGKYLFFNDGSYGTAQIIGPPFIAMGSDCTLQFFLFKNSPNSTLTVEFLLFDESNYWNSKLIKKLEVVGQNYSQLGFVKFQYQFPNSSDIHQIRISAIINRHPNEFVRPYLAIDDISFSANCRVLNPDPPITTTESPEHRREEKDIILLLIFVGIGVIVAVLGVKFYRNYKTQKCYNVPDLSVTTGIISMNNIQRQNSFSVY